MPEQFEAQVAKPASDGEHVRLGASIRITAIWLVVAGGVPLMVEKRADAGSR
jgi:hypothetical protein